MYKEQRRFFETARNRGNFDTRFYYCRQGIHALLWADSIEVISADTAAVREKLTALKYRWKNSLIEILGGYYGNGVSAVLLGEKAGLDESMKEEFRKTGIGHILAISGLHMSFIGMGLYKITTPFWVCLLQYPAQYLPFFYAVIYYDDRGRNLQYTCASYVRHTHGGGGVRQTI